MIEPSLPDLRRQRLPMAACVLLSALVTVGCAASDQAASGDDDSSIATSPAKATTTRIEFPGLTIDRERRVVDLEATVCLDRGPLELIACTRGTKEHESVVSIEALPRHVHLGLLLIGAKNGKPAMRRRLESEDGSPRWIDIPPSGDAIVVSLVLKDGKGAAVERPIGDFVTRTAVEEDDNPSVHRFPDTFLFAGSHVIPREEGEGQYLADVRGNVISISTFGDEVLCLPGMNSQDNEALTWEADPKTLPKVGTRVTLRLRPRAASTKDIDTVKGSTDRDSPQGGRRSVESDSDK